MTDPQDDPQDDDDRQDGNGVGTARVRLARALAAKFAEHNYAFAYLARRCRTTEAMIASWSSGVHLPTTNDWGFLCSVSREFLSFSPLWEAAHAEARARPGIAQGATPESSGLSWGTTQGAQGSGGEPTRPTPGPPRETGARETRTRQGSPSEALTTSLPAEGTEDPEGSERSEVSREDVDLEGAPRAASAPGRAGRAVRITVPDGFVVYACKIGGGRLVQIPLPLELTRVDVDRLHAFLLTQIDEDQRR